MKTIATAPDCNYQESWSVWVWPNWIMAISVNEWGVRSDLPHREACLSFPVSHAGNTGMSPGRLKAWHSWYGTLKMDGVGTSDCCARGFGGEGTGGGVTLRVLFGSDSFKTWEFQWKFRGEKKTSCHLNGMFDSKHILGATSAKPHFF